MVMSGRFPLITIFLIVYVCHGSFAGDVVDPIPQQDLGQPLAIQAKELLWPAEPTELPETVQVYQVTSRKPIHSQVIALADEFNLDQTPTWSPPGFESSRGDLMAFSRGDQALFYAADRNAFYLWLQHGSDPPRDEKHQPLPVTVLRGRDASAQAVDLLPKFGLDEEDFHTNPLTGRLMHRAISDRVNFIDKETNESVTMPVNVQVSFVRQIGGYSADPVGNGGLAKFTFIHEGELASVEWSMRGYEPYGEFPGITVEQLQSAVLEGGAYAFAYPFECEVLKINNVELAYHEADTDVRMRHFTPVYLVSCEINSGERDSQQLVLRVPALKMHHQ